MRHSLLDDAAKTIVQSLYVGSLHYNGLIKAEIWPRGAKVAMTVALRSPGLLGALIPVDNAPVDTNLKSDFHRYVQGMREIDERRVKKQAEADKILENYEKVSRAVICLTHGLSTHPS